MSSTKIVNRKFLFNNFHRQIDKATIAINSGVITSKRINVLHKNILNNNKWIRLNTCSNTRFLSTVAPMIATPDETSEFTAVFPDLVRDLTENGSHSDMSEINKRLAKLLNYLVGKGYKVHGHLVPKSYKLLEKPENLTPENIRKSIILGWCVEMLMGVFYLEDDFQDNSDFRWGAPCWHRLEDVGNLIVNDILLLMESLYVILGKYFSNHHCYVPVMQLFHNAVSKTSMGQIQDGLTFKDGKLNHEIFTMNSYNSLIGYKTTPCLFTSPIVSSMYLANIYDSDLHRQVNIILTEMGRLFQMKDDYLDCFGDPKQTGKSSNDIREGRCTWLSVVALQRANSQQRKIMEEYYGKDDPEAVQIIKNLYEDLDLPNIYATCEKERFNIISTQIQQVSSKELPHQVLFQMSETLCKRNS